MSRKKTPEQYLRECKEKGYDLPIEDYKGSRVKIKHRCKHGHIYEQTPTNHLKGQGCYICNGTPKKTSEQYIKECKDKGYDLPLEDYINNSTKIKHRCNQGHVYEQTPHAHLRGQGCSVCSGSFKKTPEEYAQECKDKGYDLPLEDYINNSTKIKHRCNQGHTYEQSPNSHLQGMGCPTCSGTKKKTPKEYLQECKQKGYDLPIEDYINDSTKIKHRCNQGHTYEQSPNNHLNGKGCPVCNGTPKKTSEQYIKECKDKGYDLPLEDYINNRTKIKHKCNKGHVYLQSPDMHVGKHNQGCPVCKESHGERFIRNYLDNQGINYTPQKKFNDLKDKDYLSYDFYLPDYNILIEYQGKQHYRAYDYFGGEEQFRVQQLHDNLKRKYAKDNGYRLLELHYSLDTQDKVDKYLKRRIK